MTQAAFVDMVVADEVSLCATEFKATAEES